MASGFIFFCSIYGLSTNDLFIILKTWVSWTTMHQSTVFLPEWVLSSVLTANTNTTVCLFRPPCFLVPLYVNWPSWFLTAQTEVKQTYCIHSMLRLSVAKFCLSCSSFMTVLFYNLSLCNSSFSHSLSNNSIAYE